MILDKQLELASAQVITATAASQNQVDLGPLSPAGNSHGTKYPDLVPVVAADFAAAGAATLTIQIRDALTADMANARVIATSPPLSLAELKVGQRIDWWGILPVGARRFVDANFVVGTGPFTAGAITLGMAHTRPTNR